MIENTTYILFARTVPLLHFTQHPEFKRLITILLRAFEHTPPNSLRAMKWSEDETLGRNTVLIGFDCCAVCFFLQWFPSRLFGDGAESPAFACANRGCW